MISQPRPPRWRRAWHPRAACASPRVPSPPPPGRRRRYPPVGALKPRVLVRIEPGLTLKISQSARRRLAAFDRSARSRRPAPPAVTARLDDSASLADVGESESDEWYPCFRSAAARSAASRSSSTSLAARSPRRPPAAATRAEASAPARRRSRRLASPGVVVLNGGASVLCGVRVYVVVAGVEVAAVAL